MYKVSYRTNSQVKNRLGILTLFANNQSNFHAPLFNLLDTINITFDLSDFDKWIEKNKHIVNNILDKKWHLKNDLEDRLSSGSDEDMNNNIIYYLEYNSSPDVCDRIYYSKDKLSELKYANSSLLQGEGKIPPLYYYVGIPYVEEGNDSSLKMSINNDLAHNIFLLDVFEKILKWPLDKSLITTTELFIQQNKNKINEIRGHFKQAPRQLGSGADGVAFLIAPNQVLKIFRDINSFRALRLAQKRLHQDPQLAKTEAMIYDVGVLGTIPDEKFPTIFYYSIMEKMTTVIDSLGENSQEIGSLKALMANIGRNLWRSKHSLNLLRNKFDNPKNHAEIKKTIEGWAEKISAILRTSLAEDVKVVEGKMNLNKNWLKSLIEEIVFKYLTGRVDLHIGNLGVTNYGELRYFDSIYGKNDESRINLPYFKK